MYNSFFRKGWSVISTTKGEFDNAKITDDNGIILGEKKLVFDGKSEVENFITSLSGYVYRTQFIENDDEDFDYPAPASVEDIDEGEAETAVSPLDAVMRAVSFVADAGQDIYVKRNEFMILPDPKEPIFVSKIYSLLFALETNEYLYGADMGSDITRRYEAGREGLDWIEDIYGKDAARRFYDSLMETCMPIIMENPA